MKNWYTYILLCDQKTFYVGMTKDLRRRLSEHKGKKSFFIKKFSVIQLVYVEKYKSEKEAVARGSNFLGKNRILVYNLNHEKSRKKGLATIFSGNF